jgi:hypothetical protein
MPLPLHVLRQIVRDIYLHRGPKHPLDVVSVWDYPLVGKDFTESESLN